MLWAILPAVIVCGTLLAVLAPPRVSEEANRPLGPTLQPRPSATPLPSSTPAAPEPAAAVPGVPALPATTVATATATPAPLCGGPPQMMILAVGSDEIGLADVIRVVRVDFVTPSITALTVPRDLWVAIPGLGEYGSRLTAYFGYPLDPATRVAIEQPGVYGRINTAYFYGNAYDLPGGGPEILSQTLYESLGLSIDHYVGIDMVVLADIVDAVGGIEVDVPAAIDGFSAGRQHMTGQQALAYSRIRMPDTDWQRTERQTVVLLALREKLLQPQTLAAVPELVEAFVDEVLTDLSRAQIAALTCLATRVEREQISSVTIGRDAVISTVTTRGSYILLPRQPEIEALIAAFLNPGLSPPTP